MSQRLPALVGMAKACELSSTACTFTGTEAADTGMGMACQSVPFEEFDQLITDLVISVGESSMESLAAYRDLYQAAEASGLDAGLGYEYSHDYEITDIDERLAGFR